MITQRKINQIMRRVSTWMLHHGLKLATEKTHLVLFNKCGIPTTIELHVGSETIPTKIAAKILGVRLNTKFTYWSRLVRFQ